MHAFEELAVSASVFEHARDSRKYLYDHLTTADFNLVPFVALAALQDPEEYPARFISYGDYKDKLNGLTPPPPPMPRVSPADEDEYNGMCDEAATRILESAVAGLGPFPPTGVIVFAWASDRKQNRGSHSGGFASVSPTGAYGGRNTAFFIFRTDGPGYAHELGHCLFLVHQPGSTDKDHPPAGAMADAHDETAECLMSYVDGAASLCGHCILKLAGWDTCGPIPLPTPSPKVDRHGNVT